MKKEIQQLWIEKNGEEYMIGLTAELQDDAGDISYVNIANKGNIERDETLFNVEASKAAIEIPSPLTGTIIKVNEKALDNPQLLNSTNELENWVVVMTDVNSSEFEALN